MNAEMDISKNQWRSTEGQAVYYREFKFLLLSILQRKCGFVLQNLDFHSQRVSSLGLGKTHFTQNMHNWNLFRQKIIFTHLYVFFIVLEKGVFIC